jgi:hypothetical protein
MLVKRYKHSQYDMMPMIKLSQKLGRALTAAEAAPFFKGYIALKEPLQNPPADEQEYDLVWRK